MIMLCWKIKKQSPGLHARQKYQNFEKFLHRTTFYNIKLGFFFSQHAAPETTKFMPLSAVYTVSTIQ